MISRHGAVSEAQKQEIQCREDDAAILRETSCGDAKIALRNAGELRFHQDVFGSAHYPMARAVIQIPHATMSPPAHRAT